jgi:hypothetical protein
MKKHPSLGSTAPLSLRSKGSVPPMDGTEVGKRKLKKLLPMRLGESVTYPLEHTQRVRCSRPAPPSLCPTAHCSAMACARASRKNCSRNSICTPSSGCRTACLRLTPASTRTFYSLIAPGRRAKSGIMSNRCRKAGRTTPKPLRSNLRNSRRWRHGGTSAKKMTLHGKCPPPNCWPTAQP